MANDPIVIFGTGPVGCWAARALLERGSAVRAVNRSGKRPALLPAEVDLRAADLSDDRLATGAAAGASVVVQALNPPYQSWHAAFPPLQKAAMTAAERHGARYVSVENLYMYDTTAPIREDSPLAPRSRKGELRWRMGEEVMNAHVSGRLRATQLRSADYYGPGVTGSAWGERVFGPLVAGKPAQLMGSLDVPHAVAYIEDVGRAVAELATRDEALGRVWIAPHAPARTQREMVALAAAAAGVAPAASTMGPWMMRLGGLFIPVAREMVEMLYQFTEPFVVDAGRIERELGLSATPLDVGLARTVAWYRVRGAGAERNGAHRHEVIDGGTLPPTRA
jgi:nucleoside-diphosphate-sugar epimerase